MTMMSGGGTRAARLPNGMLHAYVAAMALFPRPVSPRSALADLRDMFSRDRPHRLGFLALSVTLTAIILWGFVIDSRPPPRERQIIYVESWMADRKDSDIIVRQLADIAKYEVALAKKQNEYQKLADAVGIEWREDEARNRKTREETIAAVKRQLQKKLTDALAREGKTATAQAGASPGASAPAAR